MGTISASERLIVALDVDSDKDAKNIVKTLGDAVSFYKVGLQLFMVGGLNIVKELTGQGKKVFLDLKINDTPRTVETAVRNMAMEGVRFFTLQGNGDTAKAASKGRGNKEYLKFLQVTYLSSWDVSDLREYFHITDPTKKIDFDDQVINRTRRILQSGCDGVIASGTSVQRLRQAYPDILIVAPGIRPTGTKTDDHKRVLTPYEAITAGADYVVVGRPIYNASNQLEMVRCIQSDIQRALTENGGGATERRGLSLTPSTAH